MAFSPGGDGVRNFRRNPHTSFAAASDCAFTAPTPLAHHRDGGGRAAEQGDEIAASRRGSIPVLGVDLNRSESGGKATASGVRPSLECFRRTNASAPPAESLSAPKNFFAKTSFTQRQPPLWDRTIFGQVFVRGGMIKFSKWKVPPTGDHSSLLRPSQAHCSLLGDALHRASPDPERFRHLQDTHTFCVSHTPARPNVHLLPSIASVDPAKPVSVKSAVRRTNPAFSRNPKPPPLDGGAFTRRRPYSFSSFL